MATVDVGTLQAILRLRDDLSSQLKTAERSIQDFGRSATRIGAGLTAGLTLPIAAIGASTLKAAMDAVESENLVRESFQGMTEAATAWSEEVSDAVGSNSFKLRENAASMFLLAQNMGQTSDEAFDVATTLTELAGDLDSFLNLSAKGIDPMRALQSGLVGNTEALRSLNVFVNQATLEQIAYEKGIAETGAQLTQQQKFLATYAAILDQTSQAQGDLARTLDSPTNQMRIMREQVDQLAIEFGTALLPVFTDFLKILRDDVLPAVQSLVEWFTNLDPSTQKVVVVATALVAALGPLLVVIGQVAGAVAGLIPLFTAAAPAIAGATAALGPFAAIVAGIAGGAALGLWLRENSEGFRLLTDRIGDTISMLTGLEAYNKLQERGRDVTEEWTDAQRESLAQFRAMQDELIRTAEETENTTEAFKKMKDDVVGNSYVPDMLAGLRREFGRLDSVMLNPVRGITRLVEDAFQQMATGVGGIVGDLIGGLGGVFGGLLGNLASGLVGQAVDWIGGLFRDAEEEVNDLRDAFFNTQGGFEELGRKLTEVSDGIVADRIIRRIFDAETVDEFHAAVAEALALLDQQEQQQQALGESFGQVANESNDFAQQLLAQITALIEKVSELVAELRGIGDVRVPPINVPVNYTPGSVPGPSLPEFQHGSDGFRDFGRGTPAILHGVERVQTASQARAEDQTAAEIRKLRSDLADLPRAVGRATKDAFALSGT